VGRCLLYVCVHVVAGLRTTLLTVRAGNLCLSPRVSTATATDWPTYPRLTTFTTCFNATDASGRHALLYDRYKRLSSSGYDACFSTPSHSSCVVVDQSTRQSTCHELHDSTTTAPVASHYERLQLNSAAVNGASLDRERRLQLISQNPVMSLRRLHTSTSSQPQPVTEDDHHDDVTADDADELHQFIDQQVVVY